MKNKEEITFEETMKTFIPEYYEYIGESISTFIKGKIYKIINKNNLEVYCNFIDEKGLPNGWGGQNYQYFKPSTKEAYDAQFVVKEPETLPQFKIIESIETITKVENNEGNQFFIGDTFKSELGNTQKIIRFKYNINKTGILAVCNNGTSISINKIEHYIESKIDYNVLEYKTEGGVSCKAPFLADSHQFYINERCKIHSIKRISDDLIITVGDKVLSKTCGVPNKILSIELINNKIRLYPRNSFYNLEDILKINNK